MPLTAPYIHPTALKSSNALAFTKKYSGFALSSFTQKAAALCAIIFNQSISCFAGRTPTTSFGAKVINGAAIKDSYQAYAKENKEILADLVSSCNETENGKLNLFYQDTTGEQSPIVIDYLGELRSSKVVRNFLDKRPFDNMVTINFEEISLDPFLNQLANKLMTAISDGDNQEVNIHSLILFKSQNIVTQDFHVDKLPLDGAHLLISSIPLSEYPVSTAHTHWKLKNGDIVTIKSSSYRFNQSLVEVAHHRLDKTRKIIIDQFDAPLCVPAITTRIIPGLVAKAMKRNNSYENRFLPFNISQEMMNNISVYLAPGQGVRADLQVHARAHENDTKKVLDKIYKENPLSLTLCNGNDDEYLIEPRLLLGVIYNVKKFYLIE